MIQEKQGTFSCSEVLYEGKPTKHLDASNISALS